MARRPTRYANHPMVRYVRSLPGEYYLAREAAQRLGCSQSTIAYLGSQHPELQLGPTHKAQYGSVVLHLYTPERIEQIRAYLQRTRSDGNRRIRSGRPRVWTASEVNARRRAFHRVRKYRRRAALAREQGQDDRAAGLQRQAEALQAQLDAQLARRMNSSRRRNGTAPSTRHAV